MNNKTLSQLVQTIDLGTEPCTKNISITILIEATRLMELFIWKDKAAEAEIIATKLTHQELFERLGSE